MSFKKNCACRNFSIFEGGNIFAVVIFYYSPIFMCLRC